jgi:uncharacterized membrane protein
MHHRPFGADRFGEWAETFARFFGTPLYMVIQTIGTVLWIALNAVAMVNHWDPYPFILLNLAYSIQAGYAAPLILCAQTRQAARDKHYNELDAAHREEIARQHAETLAKLEALARETHAHVTANKSRQS